MIILKKSGIFYENEEDINHEDYIYQQIESIIPYLNDTIEIEENLTFKDLFLLIEQDEEMMNIVFSSYLGHCPLAPYIEEIKQDCIPDGREEIDQIECCWTIEQFDYKLFYEDYKNNSESLPFELNEELHKPDKNDGNEISIYIDIHGWGPYIPDEDSESSEKSSYPIRSSYGIEFIPLYRLSHIPIKLNTNFIIRNEKGTQNEKPIVQGEKSFTVIDIFGSIFSEISFCGLPEERDAAWAEIVESVNEMKEQEEDDDDNDEEWDDDYDDNDDNDNDN